jgi:hypothetical protein
MINNNFQLIGITGKKQNGKDTLGNYLVEKHNYIKYAFADSLKKGCAEFFNFNDDQLNGNKKEEIDEFWNITPRKILQFVGTDLFRNQIDNILPSIGENFWIKWVEKKIFDSIKLNPKNKFVITDVRFKNELDFIKNNNGIIIRVTRDIINNNDEHISEQHIDFFDVDYDIKNNDDKFKLYNTIDTILLWNII